MSRMGTPRGIGILESMIPCLLFGAHRFKTVLFRAV